MGCQTVQVIAPSSRTIIQYKTFAYLVTYLIYHDKWLNEFFHLDMLIRKVHGFAIGSVTIFVIPSVHFLIPHNTDNDVCFT